MRTRKFQRLFFSRSIGSLFTEAPSEGSIELKLVRKPPKVSRGCGGVAPAALGQGSPSWRGALCYNHYFCFWAPGGSLFVSQSAFSVSREALRTRFDTNFGSRKGRSSLKIQMETKISAGISSFELKLIRKIFRCPFGTRKWVSRGIELPVPEPEIKTCFRRTPGPVQIATLPWGRRKWAQPSRMLGPLLGLSILCLGLLALGVLTVLFL